MDDASPDVLEWSDGVSRCTVVAQGSDEDGPYLRLEHRTRRVGRLAGPHWHPVLTERFAVRSGRLGAAVDGVWRSLGPGESVDIGARQVHETRTEAGELVMDHEIRPPGRHREMFEFLHALDVTGRLTRWGVPANPLSLGMLWAFQDGYLVGPPPALQRVVFGGLDRLARLLGHHRRVAREAGREEDRWER